MSESSMGRLASSSESRASRTLSWGKVDAAPSTDPASEPTIDGSGD